MSADTPVVVTEAGVYTMPDATYHSDVVPGGSLSHSAAKRLLPPSCPAIFRWEQDHGRVEKRAYDFGHAAHAKILGVGAEVVVVQCTTKAGATSDAASYQTRSAQEHRDEIYAAGKTPILAAEAAQVDAMAEALRAHPYASVLVDPRRGTPEQSLFAQDAATGVWLRARLDFLPDPIPATGRMLAVDYKSTRSAERRAFAKSAAEYGYHSQAAWYTDLILTLGLASDVAFLFVAQEKTPPYAVNVFQLDGEALAIGRARNRQAIEIYRDCIEADAWPGYSTDVEMISLPRWAVYDHTQEHS